MTVYTKTNPFLASIKERYTLCKPGSDKNTQHIVLDLKGSGITYQIGDSIGIWPVNDPETVSKTLTCMGASGDETVLDRHGEHSYVLRDFLTNKANITEINRKLVAEIGFRQTDTQKKTQLESLQEESNKDTFKKYLTERYVWDLLHENPEVCFPVQELCNLLMPMLPRFYSIASSSHVVGEEVHLTVALLQYHTNGYQRLGVCTHYLCNLIPLNHAVVPIYIQPHHGFTLPEDTQTPMIMIGPGTGLAPFRAFMQERMFQKASKANWLFFGERHRATDFFYEEFWQDLVAQGALRVDLAFSRDQEYKIYVQDRMREHGEELFSWLEKGAFLFVCGDAHRMAKDVEAALLQIIQLHGKMDEATSRQYLKRLRTEKRYLRDVY
ncbi:MAG: sulfite reductase [Parachlamydiaceae bacterium]|nr:sulfite reductase [Parachlamydiaceae bacterium]